MDGRMEVALLVTLVATNEVSRSVTVVESPLFLDISFFERSSLVCEQVFPRIVRDSYLGGRDVNLRRFI